jgi:hypothetical protein
LIPKKRSPAMAIIPLLEWHGKSFFDDLSAKGARVLSVRANIGGATRFCPCHTVCVDGVFTTRALEMILPGRLFEAPVYLRGLLSYCVNEDEGLRLAALRTRRFFGLGERDFSHTTLRNAAAKLASELGVRLPEGGNPAKGGKFGISESNLEFRRALLKALEMILGSIGEAGDQREFKETCRQGLEAWQAGGGRMPLMRPLGASGADGPPARDRAGGRRH